MATGKDWVNNIKSMGLGEMQRYRDALQVLMAWDMFSDEYSWTGLDILSNMLYDGIKTKLNIKEKK